MHRGYLVTFPWVTIRSGPRVGAKYADVKWPYTCTVTQEVLFLRDRGL